jgi:hypothetical protein
MKSRSILKLAVVGALAALAVLFLIGAFTSDNKSEDAQSDTWAGSLCTAVTDYTSALKSAGATIESGNVTKESLQAAIDGAAAATETFASDLGTLGAPPVSDTQAKQHLETLSNQLAAGADKIRTATADVSGATGLVNAVSVVSSTLATAKTQVTNTVDELKALDSKGKLKDAFQNADSCAPLTGS